MAAPPGVLLAQLGTPDAPTTAALRRYLRQFLGDPRVLEMNPVGRFLLLNLVVLPRRPARSAELYRKVWTREGSPLLLHTLAQARALECALGPGVRVRAGMRYGNPSLESALEELLREGVERLLLLPLYPQYAGASTGSTCDEVFRLLRGRRALPALRVAAPYPTHPGYVEAVAQVTREHLKGLPSSPERILFSFHGIPRRHVEAGDPYAAHCRETARRVAAALGLEEGRWSLSYQSRFGKEEWLRPYTDHVLVELGRSGLRSLLVVCPGFVADCLETLDEMGNLGREQFTGAGGGDYSLAPCLNAHPAWIEGLTRIAREELSGWR